MSGLVQRGAERTQVGIFSDFPTAGREPGKQATLPSTSQTPDQGGLFRRSQHRRNYLTDKPSPMPHCLRGKGKCNLSPVVFAVLFIIAFPKKSYHPYPVLHTYIMIPHPGWQDSKICGALFFNTEEYIKAESNEPGVFITESSPSSRWMLLPNAHVPFQISMSVFI